MTQELDARIISGAHRHGVLLAPVHAAAIVRYLRLLARWNERMNLTALPLQGFPDVTLDRLVMEPLVASQLVSSSTVDWLDVGSGGGSPALPIKIVLPQLRLTMVESSLRKAAFLREAVRSLALEQASVVAQRVEVLPAIPAADLVTVRALRVGPALQTRLAHLVRQGGALLHFHSLGSEVIDWKGFDATNDLRLPTERAVVTLLRRVME